MGLDTHYSHRVIVLKREKWKIVCVCALLVSRDPGLTSLCEIRTGNSLALSSSDTLLSRPFTENAHAHTQTRRLLSYLVCLLVMFDQDGQIFFQGPNNVGRTLVGFTK